MSVCVLVTTMQKKSQKVTEKMCKHFIVSTRTRLQQLFNALGEATHCQLDIMLRQISHCPQWMSLVVRTNPR
jgi:hypothetical protein